MTDKVEKTLQEACDDHTELYLKETPTGVPTEGVEEEEYDYVKIRRRCEERLRTMYDPPTLLMIAKILKVRLDSKKKAPKNTMECRACGSAMELDVDTYVCSCGESVEVV